MTAPLVSPYAAALRLANCGTGPSFADVSIAGLAYLKNNPQCEAMEVVDFECSQGCGTMLRGPRFFASLTGCDDCRAKREKEDRIANQKVGWEAICPLSYRETDKAHPDFPRPQYEATKTWLGEESLFFYGPSGKGKTRLAMLLLKRFLYRRNREVAVLWPYELKAVKNERDVHAWVKKWGKFDVLLMDDPLQGAADGRVTDALKDLLTYRMEWKRTSIITSQIGGDDYADQAAKFGKETKADKELLAALLRRLRETCRVVNFTTAAAKPGEQLF